MLDNALPADYETGRLHLSPQSTFSINYMTVEYVDTGAALLQTAMGHNVSAHHVDAEPSSSYIFVLPSGGSSSINNTSSLVYVDGERVRGTGWLYWPKRSPRDCAAAVNDEYETPVRAVVQASQQLDYIDLAAPVGTEAQASQQLDYIDLAAPATDLIYTEGEGGVSGPHLPCSLRAVVQARYEMLADVTASGDERYEQPVHVRQQAIAPAARHSLEYTDATRIDSTAINAHLNHAAKVSRDVANTDIPDVYQLPVADVGAWADYDTGRAHSPQLQYELLDEASGVPGKVAAGEGETSGKGLHCT